MNVKTTSAPKPTFCGYCASPTHHKHKPDCRRPRKIGGKPLHGTDPKARTNITIDPDVREAMNEEFGGVSQGIGPMWELYRKHHGKA